MSDQNLEQRIRDAQANPSDPTRWIEAANALVRAGRRFVGGAAEWPQSVGLRVGGECHGQYKYRVSPD